MPVGLVVLILVVGLMLVLVAPVVIGSLSDSSRKELTEVKREARADRERLRIAEKALRSIRNDAGSPVLEADLALTEIEDTRIKELN